MLQVTLTALLLQLLHSKKDHQVCFPGGFYCEAHAGTVVQSFGVEYG